MTLVGRGGGDEMSRCCSRLWTLGRTTEVKGWRRGVDGRWRFSCGLSQKSGREGFEKVMSLRSALASAVVRRKRCPFVQSRSLWFDWLLRLWVQEKFMIANGDAGESVAGAPDPATSVAVPGAKRSLGGEAEGGAQAGVRVEQRPQDDGVVVVLEDSATLDKARVRRLERSRFEHSTMSCVARATR